MFNPLEHDLNKLYREEKLRKANRRRMAEEARRKPAAFSLRLHRPALNQLGRWLVLSGTHLQRRYGDLCETTAAPHNRPATSGNF
ncbi:MAG: hypothetical protein H6672_01340 [Anaerolineaceae bacterium]|nr:hypothetical protein [Anaerolineaceae bacterium]